MEKESTIMFDYYNDTIKNCGTHLLSCTDEFIEYYIFEELESDSISALYPENFLLFFKEGYISKLKLDKSLEFKSMIINVQVNGLWNVESFKTSVQWKNILKLADELNNM